MYKLQFVVLVLILSVSCAQDKPKPMVVKKVTPLIEVKKKEEINDSISGYINPKLGLYSFKFITDTADLQLNRINIYYESKLVQTILTNKESYGDNKYGFIDWNIDGYKDISVLWNRGATGNSAYWIWSYSPKKKKFIYNKRLSGDGLLIDSTSKYVIFHWRQGCEYEYWDSCQYINHKLRTVRYFEQNVWNDQNGRTWKKHIRQKRINGVLKETVDSCEI